jgi:peptidoglycan/xylan/chitin deacetylase (PgdA/CDA1 family)
VRLVAVLAVLLLCVPLFGRGDGALAAESPGECRLEFGADLADLHAAIGDAMGQPTGCETAIDSVGDTMQTTSSGMAWYQLGAGMAIFTDGYHRWALDRQGLTYWNSPGATPLVMDGLSNGPPAWSGSVVCPVLYTHEVTSQATFRQLIVGLLQAGYTPVSFADVDAALSGSRDVPPGCLVLSFDDALASQLLNAVPVLAEFRITALFFVMPAFSDGRHQYLDGAGIRALHDAGHIVGAHTCNHPSLTLLSLVALNAELGCRQQIEDIVRVPVRYLAYPNGAVNQTVLDATAQAGYRAAFTTRPSALLRADQPYLLPRIRYDATEAVSAIVGRLRSAAR